MWQEIKSRRMRWAGRVACRGMGEVCTGIWWRNLRERDHWGILRCRCEDNIKMEVGCGGMDWIGLAQDRERWWALVNAVMKLRVT
jgi:hypothetical protein